MPRTLKKQLTALAASSLLVGATLSIATAQQPSPDPAVLAKGEYLARAGDCDLKDRSFSMLFAPEARREVEDIITAVAEEMLAAVAGITATSEDGSLAHLELLLLPFNTRAHTPLSLTGLLAPFESEHRVLRDFKLTSWRYLGHEPQKLVPRALRKLKIARGLMVYEGLS